MLESLQRSHSIDGVPVEAQVDEVEEFLVLALFQDVCKSLGVRKAAPTSRIGDDDRLDGVLLEEEIAARAQINDVVRGHTFDFHHVSKLFSLVFSRE